MIQIKNIEKTYGNNRVLKDISLDVERGEIISIIGPSGSGKSTFLRAINYLSEPEKGTIDFGNFKVDFDDIKKSEILELRRRTAMIFQSFNLFKRKTALENVMEGLIIVQGYSEKEARMMAEEYVDKVGLLDYADFYPQHLSGGQQQRIGIARALALKPELLLLDEPTSALDPELINSVLEIIKKIADDRNTMIIVSHEMNFVKKVSDKVLFLEDGEVVQCGPPEDIFEKSENERVRKFIETNQEVY